MTFGSGHGHNCSPRCIRWTTTNDAAPAGNAPPPSRSATTRGSAAVWIVCPGVTIGENTVIGAGSVVVRDLPDHVFAAGNPARVIRPLQH